MASLRRRARYIRDIYKRTRPKSFSIRSGLSASGLSLASADPRRASCPSFVSARHHPRFDFEILPTMDDIDPFIEEPKEENQVGFDFTGPIVPGISTGPSSPSGTPLEPPGKVTDEDIFKLLPWNEFESFDGPRSTTVSQDHAETGRVPPLTDDVTNQRWLQTPTQSSAASESVRSSDESRTGRTSRSPIAAIASRLSQLSFRRRRRRQR